MAKKEITFEEICRDITARKFQPVYVLMGEEPFFIDQITDLLIENVLAEEERDFNQSIFYGADAIPDDYRKAIDHAVTLKASNIERIAAEEKASKEDIKGIIEYIESLGKKRILVEY